MCIPVYARPIGLMRIRMQRSNVAPAPNEVHLTEEHGTAVVYRITGQLTYVNVFTHRNRLVMFSKCTTIVLSMKQLFYIDLDGVHCIQVCGEATVERRGRWAWEFCCT